MLSIIWDDDSDPDGNVRHVAEHELTTDDVDYVLRTSKNRSTSHSSGWPVVFGYTPGGDYIIVVYQQIDEDTVYPITAYEVNESS